MNAFKPGEPAISLLDYAKNLILDLMIDASPLPSRSNPVEHVISSSESEFESQSPESQKFHFQRVIDDYMSVKPTGIGKMVMKMMDDDQLDGKDRSIQSFAFIFYKLETYLEAKFASNPSSKK